MIIKTRPSIAKTSILFFVLLFEILTPRAVFSDSGGWGYGWYKDVLIYIYFLPTLLFVSWLIFHLVENPCSWIGNLFRSFIDLASILYFSLLFSLFTQCANGLSEPFLSHHTDVIVVYRLVLLLLLLVVILFFINTFVSTFSRFKRVICNFGFCILVMLALLAISEPYISGPFTRWFINKDNLEKSYGHAIHHSIYLGQPSPGKLEFEDVTWLQYYGYVEAVPGDKVLRDNGSLIIYLTLITFVSFWIFIISTRKRNKIE